jgi:hypothetical protein
MLDSTLFVYVMNGDGECMTLALFLETMDDGRGGRRSAIVDVKILMSKAESWGFASGEVALRKCVAVVGRQSCLLSVMSDVCLRDARVWGSRDSAARLHHCTPEDCITAQNGVYVHEHTGARAAATASAGSRRKSHGSDSCWATSRGDRRGFC